MSKNSRAKLCRWPLFLVALICGATSSIAAPTDQKAPTPDSAQPTKLAELLALTPEQLAAVDLARINLLCAEGLHGSETLDVQQNLDTLDQWTRHVERETQRNYHHFQEHPEKFHSSLGEFRMGMLITVVQEDLRVHYNPARSAPQKRGEREPDDVFNADSGDIFIHGLLSSRRTGTCASMPVLYAAIAQKLGYPVALSSAKGHFFVRYEENGSHLNIEGSGEGFNIYADDFYRKWPYPVTDEEIRTFGFLQPLGPKQALGEFLANRAICLKSSQRFAEAAECWKEAACYLPDTPVLSNIVAAAEGRAQNARNADRLDQLWAEVEQIPLPGGPRSGDFIVWKQQLQREMNLCANLADLLQVETNLVNFKHDLVNYRRQISDLPALMNPAPDPRALMGLLANAPLPQRMNIDRREVPAAYGQGTIPAELEARIEKLSTERDIVEEMHLFYSEELQLRNLEAGERQEEMSYGFVPPGWEPKERLRFRELGVRLPPTYDNYAFLEREIPTALQHRIACRTQHLTSQKARENTIRDEIQKYEVGQLQRKAVIDVIQSRRRFLEMERLAHPPIHVQIVGDTKAPETVISQPNTQIAQEKP